MKTKNILYGSVMTFIVIAWCVANIIPWKDTPFEQYVRSSATAKQEEWSKIVDRAEEKVKTDGKLYPSVYMALKRMAAEENIDISAFFPHIDVSDQKNIQKRNEILLRVLLQRSKSKINLGLDLKGGVAVTFSINEEQLDKDQFLRAEQISKAKTILMERVDSFGVAEPIIRNKGETRIEVQLPGLNIKDNPNILEVIGAPALLEFSLVHRTITPDSDPNPPVGYRKMVQEDIDKKTGEIRQYPLYVKKVPILKGNIIKEARADINEFGGYRILLDFTDDGAKRFAQATQQIAEENQKTGTLGRLAIILDGKLYSAPTVREAITGGRAEISGDFTDREALELSNVLNNPLEVGLKAEEMYVVGPTLATDARTASLIAAGVASAFVFIFMLYLYRLGGLVSCLALVLNILIVVSILASFKGTLSLPGVAGLVLTIGMAVDANILVFERMREELRAGKSLSMALEAGYEKAFSAIVDSNLTTLMAAGILYWLGTGPIKGFGVTLAIGIVANLFTVLVTAKVLLEFLIHKTKITTLFSPKSFEFKTISFLEYQSKAFYAAAACLILGLISLVISHKSLLGIDFVGGDEMALSFAQKLTNAQVQQVAAAQGFNEVNVTYQSVLGTSEERMVVQTEAGKSTALLSALQQAYPDAQLVKISESKIGPAVGREVLWNAAHSIAAALLAMLVYIALRFEFGYGLGAVASLAFVLLMSVGLYIFIGNIVGLGSGQFTAPMVAAILMILGYAINDTIVVFDRVREELELHPTLTLQAIINQSITVTLSRTILTGTATIVSSLILATFGASIIVDFALMFLLGVLTGTFSSIFIASPLFYAWHKGDRRKVEEHHILPTYEWHAGETQKPAKAAAK